MNENVKPEEKVVPEGLIAAAGKEEDKKHMVEAPLDSEKGKAAIDNLLKTLPLEQAKKLQEALNSPNPPHVHIDENQNVFVGDEADKQVEMRKGAQNVSLIQAKRIKALQERVRRWMNNNPGKTERDAMMAIQQEDYDRMPVEQKIKRLENMLSGAVQQIARDIMTIRHNQFSIADAYDINYRAISKMIHQLGIPLEEHNKFMQAAQIEFETERRVAMEKQAQAQKEQAVAQAAAAESAKMAEEAKEAAKPSTETTGAEPPKDATVFGG